VHALIRRTVVRTVALSLVTASLLAATAIPGLTQLRPGAKDRITDAVSNEVLDMIRTSSCSDFASMLAKRKSGSKGGGSGASSRLKNDPRERSRFVDAVAGPLVNKMIDCNLMPMGRS
jgi:hypothetical protein